MKICYLFVFIALLIVGSANAFTITVLPNTSQATGTQNITVQCSQVVNRITLQMTCTLPNQLNNQTGQFSPQNAVVAFATNNNTVVAGTMNLTGIVNYANKSVTLINSLSTRQTTAPFNFIYRPTLKLNTNTTNGAILNCTNIFTTTPNCRVLGPS